MKKRGLFPDYHLAGAFELTPGFLKAEGFRAVIWDIDNTLVSPNGPADEKSKSLMRLLGENGISCFILSNNHPARVESFARELGLPYIAEAKKPNPKGFREAAARMGVSPEETLVAGDQWLTDFWGARRAGMRFLLVDALDPRHEQPFVRLKRVLEWPFSVAYRRYLAKNS